MIIIEVKLKQHVLIPDYPHIDLKHVNSPGLASQAPTRYIKT